MASSILFYTICKIVALFTFESIKTMKQFLSFSPVTESDLPQIEKLQPEFWSSIIPVTKWYLTLDFCYLIKAELNGEVVGCGAVLSNTNSAWLANIIVSKEHRNKGIGLAITEYINEYAAQQTDNVLLVATKLGRPVYIKLGFKDDEEYVFFKPHKIELPVSPNIVPYQQQFKEAILVLDAECSGEIRLNLLLPKLNEAFVYLNNSTFEGFTIPTLGEGLTFATNTQAGLALMAMRLQEEKRACLPKANKAGIDFLLEHGFEIDENLYGIKMYLNQKPNWKPMQQFGRVGGNLG
jgi:GNAT superfamily N-acetyltransferase